MWIPRGTRSAGFALFPLSVCLENMFARSGKPERSCLALTPISTRISFLCFGVPSESDSEACFLFVEASSLTVLNSPKWFHSIFFP